MLRVTTKVDEEQGSATLKLEGKLAGPWVDEFERCWRVRVALGAEGNARPVELLHTAVTETHRQGTCLPLAYA